MNAILFIKAWIQAHPAMATFIFTMIIAGPFYFGMFHLHRLKLDKEWIEREYFDVKASDEGFEVMTH